jgi:hypothetical protein
VHVHVRVRVLELVQLATYRQPTRPLQAVMPRRPAHAARHAQRQGSVKRVSMLLPRRAAFHVRQAWRAVGALVAVRPFQAWRARHGARHALRRPVHTLRRLVQAVWRLVHSRRTVHALRLSAHVLQLPVHALLRPQGPIHASLRPRRPVHALL